MKKNIAFLLVFLSMHYTYLWCMNERIPVVVQIINLTDQDVKSCLQACRTGNKERVQDMLVRGVPAAVKLYPPLVEHGYEDSTLLHWSVRHPEVVQLLITTAPDLVNAQDEEHHTPLTEAVCAAQVQSVAILLENGADPALTCLAGNNALHEVTRCAAQGFLGNALSQEEKVTRTCTIIELLKAKKAPLFLQNRTLNTPFHYAACSNDMRILRSLVMPVHTEETKLKLKKESRDRFFTFLCTLNRLRIDLPAEIRLHIFSYLASDCMHAEIESLVVPKYLSETNFLINYVKETMNSADLAQLQLTLATPNMQKLTPQQLATNENVQELLDPAAWKTKKESNDIQ